MSLPRVDQWPGWLQTVVIGTPGVLASIMFWAWWPKSDKEWRRFGILAASLIAYFLMIYVVFGWK